jgi:hypothetical protein
MVYWRYSLNNYYLQTFVHPYETVFTARNHSDDALYNVTEFD